MSSHSPTVRRVNPQVTTALTVDRLADLIWDVWLAAFIVLPVGAGLFAIVDSLAKTGQTTAVWAVLAWTFALGICIAAMGYGLSAGSVES